MKAPLRVFTVIIMLATATVGCSPSLSPLYRDYQVEAEADSQEVVLAKLETALQEAGWTIADPAAPNVVATERRTLSEWGLYRVEAYLEAAPLAGPYVRVFVHPQRKYITGGQTKIPFLGRSLRRAILPDLNVALERHGLEIAKTPEQRGVVERG